MSVCTTCLQGGITVYTEHQCPGQRPLAPGDVIHGFANGAFGRDHYDCVRIEAVGPDWIVTRAAHQDFERVPSPSFASGRRELELCQQARDRRCEHESGLCPFAGEDPPLTTWQRPV